MTLRDLLILHEDIKYKPYRCTAGKLTIGVGHNLDDLGISHATALFILDEDIANATRACEAYHWYAALTPARKAAVTDLMFNLGATRFRGFVKFIAAMAVGNYSVAGDELVNSAWCKQVGKRGPNIVHLIKYETWPPL